MHFTHTYHTPHTPHYSKHFTHTPPWPLLPSPCTLPFSRAKSIKNTASINKDMSQKALLSAYQTEIKKLKEELLKK